MLTAAVLFLCLTPASIDRSGTVAESGKAVSCDVGGASRPWDIWRDDVTGCLSDIPGSEPLASSEEAASFSLILHLQSLISG